MSRYKILLLPEGRFLTEGETDACKSYELLDKYNLQLGVNLRELRYYNNDMNHIEIIREIKINQARLIDKLHTLNKKLKTDSICGSMKKAQKALDFYLEYNCQHEPPYSRTEFEFIRE
jgi:hypothetical protein